jgi:hypothetical protein
MSYAVNTTTMCTQCETTFGRNEIPFEAAYHDGHVMYFAVCLTCANEDETPPTIWYQKGNSVLRWIYEHEEVEVRAKGWLPCETPRRRHVRLHEVTN